MLDSMAVESDLTDVYNKWLDKKPITDLEASQLLQLFIDAEDEMKWKSED
jgi:hypothetical protein